MICLLETDVYEPMSNWMKTRFGLEWSKITHENPCVIIDDEGETAEVDIILGKHRKNQLELTDVIHVKTKDNLQHKTDRYELLGKAGLTLSGAKRVWLGMELSTYRSVLNGLNEKLDVITYVERGNNATSFTVKKEAKEASPKYNKEAQDLVNKKYEKIVFLS